MWMNALVAYLHYASFMVSFAALAIEHFTLTSELSLRDAWKVSIADATYGLAATTLLVTGILRVLYFGNGPEFYINNPIFWTKIGLFSLVVLLSLYPTVSFIRWVGPLRQQQAPPVTAAQAGRLVWFIRLELMGFIAIPLSAALMARGIGLS